MRRQMTILSLQWNWLDLFKPWIGCLKTLVDQFLVLKSFCSILLGAWYLLSRWGRCMKSTSVMVGIASMACLVDCAGCKGLELCCLPPNGGWVVLCKDLKHLCTALILYAITFPPVLSEMVKSGWDKSAAVLLYDLHGGQGFTIVPEGSGSYTIGLYRTWGLRCLFQLCYPVNTNWKFLFTKLYNWGNRTYVFTESPVFFISGNRMW